VCSRSSRYRTAAGKFLQPDVPSATHVQQRGCISRPCAKQVKKVAGVGLPSDSCIVDGVVCRKNLAHKRMRRHIVNPKILMVGGNLEYNRAQTRLTSLEGITKQQVLSVTL